MKTTGILIGSIVLLLSVTGVAAAQERSGRFGFGAESTLSGINGAALVYDAGKFHISGIIGVLIVDDDNDGNEEDETLFALAGRFFYHLHSTSQSDFSIGGGIGLVSDDQQGANEETNVNIEGGVQIRFFIVDNVALSASAGLSIVLADTDVLEGVPWFAPGRFTIDADSVVAINGQIGASFGIAYFF